MKHIRYIGNDGNFMPNVEYIAQLVEHPSGQFEVKLGHENLFYIDKKTFDQYWEVVSRTVPMDVFIKLLDKNIDNEKLSDKEFRNIIRNTLSIVKGSDYTERNQKIYNVLNE